jgi:hypothetical protein
MMYKTSPFQSLIDLQSIVHIIIFYEKIQNNVYNDAIDFKLFVQENHMILFMQLYVH